MGLKLCEGIEELKELLPPESTSSMCVDGGTCLICEYCVSKILLLFEATNVMPVKYMMARQMDKHTAAPVVLLRRQKISAMMPKISAHGIGSKNVERIFFNVNISIDS